MICLIIPGLNSSGPEHWQTRWEEERHDCRRVELGHWDDPTREDWVNVLDQAVRACAEPPILAAHSLGCLAVAWWASEALAAAEKQVAAALLVAPPDVEREDASAVLERFAPIPRRPLPFPAMLVASRNDPYADLSRSRSLAAIWRARSHDAGEVGHLNAASGLGSWKAGQRLLSQLSHMKPA